MMVTHRANSVSSKPLQPGSWPRALSMQLSTSGDSTWWRLWPLAHQQV